MASKSNFTGRAIPSLSTRKSAPTTTNFAKGIYTYKPNDTMGLDELRLAQDARFDRVGEYGTRLGYKRLSKPIGYASYKATTDSIGVCQIPSLTPYTFTAESDATLCSIKFKACKINAEAANDYIAGRVTLSVNGENVTSSCFQVPNTTEKTEAEVYFNDAPSITTGDEVTITFDTQSGYAANAYIGSVGTTGDDATTPYFVLNSCTAGAITNVFEANIDGTITVLFVQNGILYRMATDGTITAIRTLPEGVTKVRFSQNLNQIRYTDGKEGPRLIDPSNSWSDAAIPTIDLKTDTDLQIKTSNIMPGPADNIIYFNPDVNTEAVWTYPYGFTYAKTPRITVVSATRYDGAVGTIYNIFRNSLSPNNPVVGDWCSGNGNAIMEVTSVFDTRVEVVVVDPVPQTISSYDKFCVDYYQNFPAIKTGDPLTAMFNLGGVIYMMTRRNKYLMYTQSADSWTQSASNAQNGTFSQESIVCDLNYAYFANDNGIYVFDGSSEASITENSIQNVYDAIPNKENIVLDLFNNRLYVYYTSEAGGVNDHCLVYNINLRVWESFDSNTYVAATSARQNSSSRFICGHSKIGMLMLNESPENNDYSDFGGAIAFNLETSYAPYGATSQLKRITKWRPEFATSDKPYAVQCGYALDYTDSVNYAFSVNLQDLTTVTENYVWDNPSDYGVPAIPTTRSTIPRVNGEFYRCQIRYQHIAAFEPVIFRSHVLTIQTQRIR